MFVARYAHVYKGDEHWQKIEVEGSDTYQWRAGSTYVANPPYFEGMTMTPAPVADIIDAKPLAILGDSITTDHISPAGSIKADSPAGKWRSEEHTSELQSLMRISYAVFCLKKKNTRSTNNKQLLPKKHHTL